ncbi:type II toxin-antitoxin system VapC family toxin [Bosea sp. (in: a-proteobacteria)]|uniref:type II toxin-antitoxin system VapC family toxin n=1 Tax=Bosea sp. (in: a-proteobacteria) TaxID=1871050 RepID=UPI002FCAECC3
MIVLDANVVSEAMKPSASAAVIAWLDEQVIEAVYLSSATLAELLYGIESLPQGRRKDALAVSLDGLLALFGGRILPFDAEAARCYGRIAARARLAGKGLPLPDGYIAATAAAHGFAVATRDTAPFHAAGLQVIDPWAAG